MNQYSKLPSNAPQQKVENERRWGEKKRKRGGGDEEEAAHREGRESVKKKK